MFGIPADTFALMGISALMTAAYIIERRRLIGERDALLHALRELLRRNPGEAAALEPRIRRAVDDRNKAA